MVVLLFGYFFLVFVSWLLLFLLLLLFWGLELQTDHRFVSPLVTQARALAATLYSTSSSSSSAVSKEASFLEKYLNLPFVLRRTNFNRQQLHQCTVVPESSADSTFPDAGF